MSKPSPKPTPTDELIARFQLQSEGALKSLEDRLIRCLQETATKVAVLEDKVTLMKETADRQQTQLEDALHHMRKGVEECNLAMKESAKAAQESAVNAAVFEKLKESQPDFHRMIEAQNVRLAHVVDKNTHIQEQLGRLVKQLEEFEVVADSMEGVTGEVRGLDATVRKLDTQVRASRPI